MKVSDENRRIQIQDPDPLVRGMDPQIRIWIHPKMSWIRNTAKNTKETENYWQRDPLTDTEEKRAVKRGPVDDCRVGKNEMRAVYIPS